MKKITIHGIGYVGLVLGVGLAEIGHDIICFNEDEEKNKQLNEGITPFYEPNLSEFLKKNLANKRIKFSNDPVNSIQHGDYQFITKGTPSHADGSTNLTYVFESAKTIGQFIEKNCIIINKSTSPVGTTQKLKEIINSELTNRAIDIKADVAFSPEFLQEGSAIKNFMHPNRIIIGSENPDIINEMYELFKPTIKSDKQFISMDIRSAELSKYASNAFLAMKISFINEVANLAEGLGADILQIKKGIGSDERINPFFLNAGCGYGGSCFSKDLRSLTYSAETIHCSLPLIDSIEKTNHQQKQIFFKKILQYFKGNLKNKTIAVWGLAFKPNSSDMREAVSITILQKLWQHGAKVKAYDPVAVEEAKKLFGDRDDLLYCAKKEDVLIDADALVVITEWKEFFNPDFQLIKKHLSNNVIFDGRNIYHPKDLEKLGIEYFGIGQGIHHSQEIKD